MKKILLLFIPLFISGCPMGDKVNLRPAKATTVGSRWVNRYVEKIRLRLEHYFWKVY